MQNGEGGSYRRSLMQCWVLVAGLGNQVIQVRDGNMSEKRFVPVLLVIALLAAVGGVAANSGGDG